ncbi:MAG: hypothetical protein P8074_09775 [Anaerolineales bacterium]|jgi:hypothetical protein
MKQIYLFLTLLFVLSLAACGSPVTAVEPSAIPTTEIPASATPLPATPIPPTEVPAATPSNPEAASVTYGPLSFTLPAELGSGITGSQLPPAEGEGVATWDVTPGHTQITLDGYPLQEKFHQPQIFVYPAAAYAELSPGAFESIHRLDNILYDPAGINLDQPLPFVPFFNAAQVFASNVQAVSFQGGGGVRFVTEYAQGPVPVNNHDLLYNFQGLSRDGTYYIIAIFPITAPNLAETSDLSAPVPQGGIAFPALNSANPDIQGYYAAVTDLLNGTDPKAFSPTLGQLDALIQSMQIVQ